MESFAYDTTRCKTPVRFVPLPPEFFPFIGQIVVLWDAIETLVNELVRAMCAATQAPPEAVDKRFLKRAKQVKDLARTAFAEMPSARAYIDGIADEGVVLQGRLQHRSQAHRINAKEGARQSAHCRSLLLSLLTGVQHRGGPR